MLRAVALAAENLEASRMIRKQPPVEAMRVALEHLPDVPLASAVDVVNLKVSGLSTAHATIAIKSYRPVMQLTVILRQPAKDYVPVLDVVFPVVLSLLLADRLTVLDEVFLMPSIRTGERLRTAMCSAMPVRTTARLARLHEMTHSYFLLSGYIQYSTYTKKVGFS